MPDSSYIATILGYSLFALSEFLPLLPIPANGFLHSIAIGLQNSFSNKPVSTDIEIAQNLLISRPNMPNIISTLEGNNNLINSIKLLNDKPQLLAQLNKLAYDKNLQFINTLLINNPDIINEIKNIIINILKTTQIQPQQIPVVTPDLVTPQEENSGATISL
jgi:hypothetical protein